MDLPPLADNLFLQVKPKQHASKSQKREDAQIYSSIVNCTHPLDGGAAKLLELQHSDQTWRQPDQQQTKGFFWEDGLLYRMWTPEKDDEPVQQLTLPQQYRQSVLKTAHFIPMAGHLGRKTTSRIQQKFYWPRLRDDVAEMCKGCIECQKTARLRKHRAPMIPLPVMDQAFQRIAMDMVGLLPWSKAGHKYILTICDYSSSRYPEAIPLKSTDSKHVAETLIPFFSHVGLPQEILSNCGTNFTSRLIEELYSLLGIHAIKTSPYHLQTDGLIERFNATMKSMLRKVIQKFDKQWNKALP